jgi:hypothetical protein
MLFFNCENPSKLFLEAAFRAFEDRFFFSLFFFASLFRVLCGPSAHFAVKALVFTGAGRREEVAIG